MIHYSWLVCVVGITCIYTLIRLGVGGGGGVCHDTEKLLSWRAVKEESTSQA